MLIRNSVDLDQLASEKPADLDMLCFQKKIDALGSVSLVRVN